MDKETGRYLLEMLRARDTQLFHLSDTLDVKASILLAVVTLALIQADRLESGILPSFSILFLMLSGCCALLAMRPRMMEIETPEIWRAYGPLTEAQMTTERIKLVETGIKKNSQVIGDKASMCSHAYWLLVVGLGLYLFARLV